MKVKELIGILSKLDQDKEIYREEVVTTIAEIMSVEKISDIYDFDYYKYIKDDYIIR